MSYKKVGWEDSPSSNTPILSVSLNQMDDGIEKANKGIVFSYSATFTSDGVPKNTTSTEALGAGSFATSQTDIVTVFVADNVTKINNGAFSNCTSLKTIYIDNTVGNVDIVSGAVPSGVSIVYSNDDNFINVNELLASAIKLLKKQVNADKSDWENRATSIEAQHKTDVTELSQTIQKVKESALEEFASVKADLDKKENVSNKVNTIDFPSTNYYPSTKAVMDFVNEQQKNPNAEIEKLKVEKVNVVDFNAYKTSNDSKVNNKVDSNDFDTYKTKTDKAIKDNADNIKLLETKKANLVQSKNLFDMKSYLNFLNELATKSVVNGTLDNIDSSSFTFTTTGHDCYTNGWTASSKTIFKIQVQQNTTYTMSWDFNGSDGSVFVFFNGVSGSGNMVQTKNSKRS